MRGRVACSISLSSIFFITPSPSGDFVMKKIKKTGQVGSVAAVAG